MIAPLHTETAVKPLRYRRLELALRYLHYLISLPHSHFAHAALVDSASLANSGHSGWFMDLQYALNTLTPPIHLPSLSTLNGDKIMEVINDVSNCMKSWLNDGMSSDKMYLLHGRLEPEKDRPPVHKTMCLRHYLTVQNAEHRRALTRLLLSDHCLAVEQLRHSHPMHIPREYRLCRFCKHAVETPEHALLECTRNIDLAAAQSAFMQNANQHMPSFLLLLQSSDALSCFKVLLYNRSVTALLTKYTHDVLLIYSAHPIYDPGPILL